MSRQPTIAHQLASELMRLAGWLLPRAQEEWAEAMRTEIHYLEGEGQSLSWSLGCLSVCARARAGSWLTAQSWRRAMRKKIAMGVAGFVAISFMATATTYYYLAPYQKDRLAIWMNGGSKPPSQATD